MNETVTINFENGTERIRRLRQAMSPSVRQRIVPMATRRVFNLIQRHFTAYANSHHETADELGAPHTKHMERAARDMTHESTATEGRVTLAMAGIGRAFHDVDIKMKDRRLTLPIAKESYGKRVIDMKKKYGGKALFVFKSKKGNAILAASVSKGRGKAKTRTTIPLYVLRTSVHQKQDATMLPKRGEISDETYSAMKECIEQFLGGGE